MDLKAKDRISFNIKEKETYAKFIQDYAKKEWGAKSSLVETEGTNGIRVCVFSVVLQKFLEGLFGKTRAKTKNIPNSFFDWPDFLKMELIKGIFRGDGSYREKRRVSLTTSSHALVSKIRLLLLTLGIQSSLYYVIPKKHWATPTIRGRKIPSLPRYSLEITGASFNKFAEMEEELEKIDMAYEEHRLGYIDTKRQYFYVPIRKIDTIPYSDDVYDLTVEDGHSFTSVCTVHNSGPAFRDVPIFGPLLSATIGRVVKPPVYMHTNEWLTPQGGTLYPPHRAGGAGPPVATVTGTIIGGPSGIPPGAIQAPGGIKEIAGEQIHRFQELVGLPGFMLEAIKNQVTGTKQWWSEYPRLRTAGAMYGSEELRGFWEANAGDPLALNEFFRRLYPHKERTINRIEPPIENTMPTYLPGPGSRSPDYLHGDAFSKAGYYGEAVLPGKGMAALHPELRGVSPWDYDEFWRFYTLARVAPYSSKYKKALGDVKSAIHAGLLSPDKVERVERIIKQVQELKTGEKFYQRRYGGGRGSATQQLLEANERAKQGRGGLGGLLGRYWEAIGLHLEQPIEALTPIAPASKILHMRTALQAYKREQVYGPKMAMWETPIKSFIKPFFEQIANEWLGMEGIPSDVQQRRRITEYFDILKYIKYTRLKRAAEEKQDKKAAMAFEELRRSTMVGVNPLGHNYRHLYRSLPYSIRPYFKGFVDEVYDSEKEQILKYVPQPIRPLLLGQWKLRYKQQLQKALKTDELVGVSTGQARDIIEHISEEQKTEGFPINDDLKAEYLATRIKGESYADWYRRKKITQRLEELNMALPGPDWVGWGPAELDDIKMKYILEEGKDLHDFGLWPERMYMLPYKTYVNDNAIEAIEGTIDIGEAERRLKNLLENTNAEYTISMIPAGGYSNSVNIDVGYDAVQEVKDIKRKYDED